MLLRPLSRGLAISGSLRSATGLRSVPVRRATTSEHTKADEDDIRAARQWLSGFKADTIPRQISELSFSRSSGPGGQNVNKVNSKATLHVPLEALLPLLPRLFHQPLRAHRTYSPRANALVIQSDESRKQGDNVQNCYDRLHELIGELGRQIVPGEASAAKKKQIGDMIKSSNEARIRSKKTHSSKKSARRGGSSDD